MNRLWLKIKPWRRWLLTWPQDSLHPDVPLQRHLVKPSWQQSMHQDAMLPELQSLAWTLQDVKNARVELIAHGRRWQDHKLTKRCLSVQCCGSTLVRWVQAAQIAVASPNSQEFEQLLGMGARTLSCAGGPGHGMQTAPFKVL